MKRDWLGVAVFTGCTVAAVAVTGFWFFFLYAAVHFVLKLW